MLSASPATNFAKPEAAHVAFTQYLYICSNWHLMIHLEF